MSQCYKLGNNRSFSCNHAGEEKNILKIRNWQTNLVPNFNLHGQLPKVNLTRDMMCKYFYKSVK